MLKVFHFAEQAAELNRLGDRTTRNARGRGSPSISHVDAAESDGRNQGRCTSWSTAVGATRCVQKFRAQISSRYDDLGAPPAQHRLASRGTSGMTSEAWRVWRGDTQDKPRNRQVNEKAGDSGPRRKRGLHRAEERSARTAIGTSAYSNTRRAFAPCRARRRRPRRSRPPPMQ